MKNNDLNISYQKINDQEKNIPIICIRKKPVYSFLKRVFDILCSFFGLLVLMIPFIIIALIIIIDSPGASPIYVQDRVGKNGRIFKFYKFRSMIPNAEKMIDSLLEKNEMEGPAFKIKNDPRITRVGRFIRKTSIDEFPQLWNVLKGDMSLVGERGIIETTKKNIGFSRVVAVNSISS